MKFNKLAVIFLTLSLCGCSKDYNIEPNKLPIAHIGKEYNQTLKITGGRVIPQSFEVKDNFPSDMNISIEPIDQNEADAYNNLKISGVPTHKGTFTINIYASFYAGGDDKLNKTYEFVVKE